MLDALALLKRAISISSVSGQEAEVARFFAEQMAAFCTEAFVDQSGSAVGKLGGGPLKVAFLGHIDTVPGDIPVRIEDGELWGRGAVDAKGAFCTAVAAAARLSEGALERLSLSLIGATEEEAPSSKGARFAAQTYAKPDLVIIGEPSGWEAVTLGYKGRLVLKLEHEKPNFHSAGADTTAAEDIVNLYQVIRDWAGEINEGVQGIFDKLQVSLQQIESRTDGLTQRALATVGFRLPPRLEPDGLEQILREKLSAFQVNLSFTGHEQAYRSEKDTTLSRAFRIAIREHGGSPRFKVKTGTSDMNVVAPIWNVPMLAYGPGDASLDHTPEERLRLEDYENAVAVLTTALEHLAKTYSPESS